MAARHRQLCGSDALPDRAYAGGIHSRPGRKHPSLFYRGRLDFFRRSDGSLAMEFDESCVDRCDCRHRHCGWDKDLRDQRHYKQVL